MRKHFFIAGPCVIENEKTVMEIAENVKLISEKFDVEIIFKASFDKANRTSVTSFRGVGIEKGMEILSKVKERFNIKITTDIHLPSQAEFVKEFVDIIQIPAFLCRQTDILVQAGKTGKIVNIKKGQFVAPWDMKYAVEKVKSTGNNSIMITERGASFGYNNLVVDFRGMKIMQELSYPIVYDATHSMQLPSVNGKSQGTKQYAKWLAFAAASIGVDGIFFEVHTNPQEALSDASTMLDLKTFSEIVPFICEHWRVADKYEKNS